jgi:hypothetical protein
VWSLVIDSVRRYVEIIEGDVDELGGSSVFSQYWSGPLTAAFLFASLRQLRSDLLTVVGQFLEHASNLTNVQEGWQHFIRGYLSSVEHIVGKHVVLWSSTTTTSKASDVPTDIIDELESLRAKIEELSDQVSLKARGVHTSGGVA